MNALQKIKLSKELLSLIGELKAGELPALAKVKASKRVIEIVTLLGGAKAESPVVNEPAEAIIDNSQINSLYQSVIDGAEPTLDLLNQLKVEALKDLEHPQLRPAVNAMVEKVKLLVGAA